MSEEKAIIAMEEIELKASLMLMAAFTSIFVSTLDPSKHDEKSARKAIEDECDKIVIMAKNRKRI